MAKNKGGHGPADYQIIVNGRLDNRWSDWFAGTTVEPRGAVTIIKGNALDQPALHGLLVRIQDLGLPLICVKRVERERRPHERHES